VPMVYRYPSSPE